MSDRPTVFCKDCKLLIKAGFLMPLASAKCGHPSAVVFGEDYLVDPDAIKRKFASTMRYASSECGPDGKLWEPRK